MSSQASSAGRDEARVRQKLIETGDVDLMIAIRSNFFYTRTVPCELWFLNRDKPEAHRDKVLMIDARNIYRKVTRKIYDFSLEQEQNLLAIVRLYRGQTDRYLELVAGYCRRMLEEGAGCFTARNDDGDTIEPLPSFIAALAAMQAALQPFLKTLPADGPHAVALKELDDADTTFKADAETFRKALSEQQAAWKTQQNTNGELKKAVDRLAPLAEAGRNLVKQTDLLYKLACRLIDTCENECDAKGSDAWSGRDIARARKAADEEDENFDFEETLREIHVELEDLNAEAVKLAAAIRKNFEELRI
jgi:type I restriction enzyme M protein